MYKYKITKVTDRQGVPRTEFLAELKSNHPDLTGYITWPNNFSLFRSLIFEWDDNSGKMLRTSNIEKIVGRLFGFEIMTRNSIYTLERIKNKGTKT